MQMTLQMIREECEKLQRRGKMYEHETRRMLKLQEARIRALEEETYCIGEKDINIEVPE